jgi:hypothetical protein
MKLRVLSDLALGVWDEEYQLSVHRQRWNEKPWFIVMLDGKRIGTASIHEH